VPKLTRRHDYALLKSRKVPNDERHFALKIPLLSKAWKGHGMEFGVTCFGCGSGHKL